MAKAAAPSWSERLAAWPMQNAAKSGWWLAAGNSQSRCRGWMAGTICETFPMSVDARFNVACSGVAANDVGFVCWHQAAYGRIVDRTNRGQTAFPPCRSVRCKVMKSIV